MKKIFLMLLLAASMSISAFAQKISADKVPSSVSSTFKGKFSNATKINWEMEKAEYEANFTLKGEEVSATFDKTGKWLETETVIKISALPTAIQQALKKDFANFKVNEASKIESVKNGNSFEAEVEKGEETFDVLFAPDGKVINQTKTEKEKDEKKD